MTNAESKIIPTTLHFIWIQGWEHLPDRYKSNIEAFKSKNESWKLEFWDDHRIRVLMEDRPKLLEVYELEALLAGKADIARYYILYKHGGWYLDMDTECLRPLDALKNLSVSLAYVPCESWYVKVKNWASRMPSPYKVREVHNCFLAMGAGHAVWAEIERLLLERKGVPDSVVYRTGPLVWTDALFAYHAAHPEDHSYLILSRWMFVPIELGDDANVMKEMSKVSLMRHLNDGSWSVANRRFRWWNDLIWGYLGSYIRRDPHKSQLISNRTA